MKPIYKLSDEFLAPLDRYKDWVFSTPVQESLGRLGITRAGPAPSPGREEELVSLESLLKMDHDRHLGPPVEQLGINLNYRGNIERRSDSIEPAFFAEIRAKNDELDDELQHALGARQCALKMYYPANGYIGWHTNWDLPGCNIIFTYSPTGNGYWRHIDPAGSRTVVPNGEKLVHIPDVKGWHCKVGQFGRKDETDKLVWHSAFAREPRLTVSYVIFERKIWENMVDELLEGH
jgi:hypothetical protein